LQHDATISQQATKFSSDDFYEVGTRLATLTGTATLVTLGERGCLMSAHGNVTYLEAYRPLGVVDTTGAGDVFNGVLAWGLRSALPLEVAVQKAQAAASIACEGLGGRGRIPTVDDIELRYTSQAPRISRIGSSSDEPSMFSP
jgi:ribokinase